MSEALPIIALVLAVVATILALIFIVPEKRREKLNKFGRFLHDTFNFKYLVVERILQTLYILSTIFIFILGFCMLFYVEDGYSYYYRSSEWYGGYGLLLMILGPIAVRLSYEFLMMALLLVKNVIAINKKLGGTADQEKEEPLAVALAPEAPVAPAAPTCPNCGANVEGMNFCNSCGAKIN